jgi:hypothetical protein
LKKDALVTTIFERVNAALNTLSPAVPFAMAPYKSSGALPVTYIAYQLIVDLPEQSADNVETERSYTVQVSIYSTAGLVSLPNVDAAMLAAGFFKDDERPIPQDMETHHYGLAKDYVYFESKE